MRGQGLLLLGGLLANYAAATPSPESLVLTSRDHVKDEYDYVIVGGGTAGLTVADRLTESGRYSVLVIEYGTYDNSSSVTTVYPGYNGLLNATHLFDIPSVPQPGLGNRVIQVVVAKMLGGSSGVNGLGVHRGTKEDYDRWGNFFPRPAWRWDTVLPYFKKAMTFTPPPKELAQQLNITTDSSWWGKTSRIFATFPTFNWPFLPIEMAAFKAIPGVNYPPDSGAGQAGVFWFPTSEDPVTVTRSFARTGHWDGIHRPNYQTITSSRVIKVVVKNGVATGVVFVPSSAETADATNMKTVRASKEVIMAAGTIHNPQILQNSGIGPKALLKSANITVQVNLPGVGHNFQDHPYGAGPTYEYTNLTIFPQPSDLMPPGNASFIAYATELFNANRTGPYSLASGNAATFLPLPVIAPDVFESIARSYERQNPAAYLPAGTDPTIIAGYAAQQKALAKAMRSRGTGFYNLYLFGDKSFAGSIVLLHPTSRGTVLINTTNPVFGDPVVDYRALSNPADLQMWIAFTRFTRRYFSLPSLAQYGPHEVAPGSNVTSDADIAAYVRTSMNPSTFHPVGTCSMLPRELGGVVGQDLLVYGVKHLSVVDASIMPTMPGAYTQQTTYMIAEKAADIIKSRH